MKAVFSYSKQKQTEPNFEKLSNLFNFLLELKTANQFVKALSIESLFQIILLMDTPTLIQYNSIISMLILNLFKEIYSIKEKNAIGLLGEEANKIPLQLRAGDPIPTKDLCVDTIAFIVIKLDQSGNTQQEFLSVFLKYFTEIKWELDSLAGEIFSQIIDKATNTLDILCLSIEQSYSLLLDQLIYYAKSNNSTSGIVLIKRILKILNTCSKVKLQETAGIFLKAVNTTLKINTLRNSLRPPFS